MYTAWLIVWEIKYLEGFSLVVFQWTLHELVEMAEQSVTVVYKSIIDFYHHTLTA